MHELWVQKQDKTYTNITPLLSKISWTSNLGSLGDQLKFDLITSDAKYIPNHPVTIGKIISLRNKNLPQKEQELFRGEIFTERKSSREAVSFDAFDYAFFLNKSKDFYQFNDTQANKAIEDILKNYNVPIGNIPEIPLTINKIYANKQVANIIKDILTLVEEQRDEKYYMEMYNGKFNIRKEEKEEPIEATFNLAENLGQRPITDFIINPSRTRSITNMKNSIKIISDKEVLLKKDNQDYINQYGLLQEVKSIGKDEKDKAETIAKNLLKDLAKISEETSLTLPGHDAVRAGRRLKIQEKITGIDGTYRVKSCTHSLENGHHWMNLSLEKLIDG